MCFGIKLFVLGDKEMDKKQIQRDRMMNYFIEATKKIIEEEGLKKVTVRRVGDLAAYSYATIYNYFKDTRELLAHCALHYLEAFQNQMKDLYVEDLDIREQIIKYSEEYFIFFSRNPEIFNLIYTEDLGPFPELISKTEKKPVLRNLLKEHLQICAEKNYIKYENIDYIHSLIISSIHGKLLLYVNKRRSEKSEEYLRNIKKEIRFLLSY